jgi:hypothetical protein
MSEEKEVHHKGGSEHHDAPPMIVNVVALAEPPPQLNKVAAERKSPFHRLWTWLQVVPPPLPLLTDLDRSHDGSLELRQNLLSGRFVSAKLEAAYAAYTLAVWRPRLRTMMLFLAVVEVYLMIRGHLCRCGLRYVTYEGWARVYSFGFLIASIFVLWLILSPKLARYTTRMMPWLIPVVVLVDLVGYAIPLALYLDNVGPEIGASNVTEDADAMRLMQLSLVDQGAWFTNAIMIFTLFTSLASVTFGVGAFPMLLLTPVAIAAYLLFERKRFGRQYGIEPSLVPQAVIVYALCSILTFCHTGSTRQQFILRIYVSHERDLRVEQLEQEKERLDYERRFALRQQTQEGAQQKDSSTNSEGRGVGISFAQQPRQGGGLALNEGRGAGGFFFGFSSAASSSGAVSEPELASLGRGARASLTAPQVAASCGGRARQLMQGNSLDGQGAAAPAGDHRNALSAASGSTISSGPQVPAADWGVGWVHGGASSNTIEPDAGNPGLSDERMQALERTLTSMRIRW